MSNLHVVSIVRPARESSMPASASRVGPKSNAASRPKGEARRSVPDERRPLVRL
jgi:hypothetical protein